jgi:hypothetical protein
VADRESERYLQEDKYMTNHENQGRTGKIKTADDLEREITTILKHLPIALTISKRDVDRYAWHWLDAQGEGDSFVNALENALTHVETEYLALRKA